MDSPFTRRMEQFRDILAECCEGDFRFLTKDWYPLTTHTPVHKTNPKQLKRDVLFSKSIQDVVEELRQETGRRVSILYTEVHNILDEIGYNYDMSVIRWMGMVLLKMMKTACSGLMVNEPSITRIKAIMGNNPLVLAPTHRSYADFLLLSLVCFKYDIEIPVVAAGLDFHEMCGMGRILRNCCAFFMRRSFGDDKLYWTVFREYVSRLITDNDAPVEFFIEGTRSRSGKSLPPKLGFLSMVLGPLFHGRIEDVTIVPVSISYDRTLEETLFTYELLGVPKPKESTSGLFKALNVVTGQYGRTYIEFGAPCSVNQFFSTPPPRVTSLLYSGVRHDIETEALIDIACGIIRQQQQHGVLTAFNLIAVLLNDSLFTKHHKLYIGDLIAQLTWLKYVMENFGALVDFQGSYEVRGVVDYAMLIHNNLVHISPSSRSLSLANIHPGYGSSPYFIAPGHYLYNETMRIATPVVMLQQYINPCLNFLITPAVITVVLEALRDEAPELHAGELFEKYLHVRCLLQHDFVLCRPTAFDDFSSCLRQMQALNVVEMTRSYIKLGSNMQLQSLLRGLLRPFFFGYLALCIVLKEATGPRTAADLTRSAQKKVESILISDHLIHPYSLAMDVFTCALRSLTCLHAAVRVRGVAAERMYHSGPELHRVIHLIDRYIPHYINLFYLSSSEKEPFNGNPSGGLSSKM